VAAAAPAAELMCDVDMPCGGLTSACGCIIIIGENGIKDGTGTGAAEMGARFTEGALDVAADAIEDTSEPPPAETEAALVP
jgi:hypothetical protein